MKILFYILTFAVGYLFGKINQAHKHTDEPDGHADDLIRREQDAETYGEL